MRIVESLRNVAGLAHGAVRHAGWWLSHNVAGAPRDYSPPRDRNARGDSRSPER